MTHLIALSYSPWSEKARWALDHHRVPYRYEEYVPMLGEPLLRARLRRLTGKVTVPVLLHEGGSYTDSFDIARHAERAGTGEPLFPPTVIAEIMRWNERSESGLAAGRTLAVEGTASSVDAQVEALPPFVPASVRPMVTSVARLGVSFLRSKYKTGIDRGTAEASLAGVLEELRTNLAGEPYLFEELTYADITMAVTLQFVRPVRDAFIPLGAATRRVWTNEGLSRRFADLIDWRDALYEKHRRG